MSEKSVPYSEVAKSLEMGDLFLFSGNERSSRFNEFLEGCKYSHVGMVMRMPNIKIPLLWESTELHDLEDEEFHVKKTGVQLVSLYDRLVTYDGTFDLRKLNVERTDEMVNSMYQFIFEVHDEDIPSFKKSIIEVIEAKIFNKDPSHNTYFCSELIAETYMRLGLLGTEKVASSYMPKNFSEKGHLPLLKGSLGPETPIDASC